VLALGWSLAKNKVWMYNLGYDSLAADIEAYYSTSTLDSKNLAELFDADWSVLAAFTI
jgi:hypothetical protein